MKPGVLVVAGLDPSGGAGILADAEAIQAAGCRPFCCVSALTVQTTRRVRAWHPVAVEVVRDQIVALAEEEAIGAVKLGMLGRSEMATMLAELKAHPRLRGLPWVVDPVLASSSGAALIDGGPAAYGPLLAAGVILTPNLDEAAALTLAARARDAREMEEAGRRLLELGAKRVFVKGGHLEGEPLDLLVEPSALHRLGGRRRPGTKRGTGCRLASHLAGRLATGMTPLEAAREAKAFVAAYLDEA